MHRFSGNALVREGVTDVFGYPGGAILPAYDAMLEYPIRHILVRHEQGATHMADGYARASGSVGVAIATSGPGATNMVTGIATAMMDSSPIVCITGQVGSKLIGSDAFQETDITGITLPITKHNYLVTQRRRRRAGDPRGVRRRASRAARAGARRHHQGRAAGQLPSSTGTRAEPHLTEAYDDALPGDGDRREALALINAAERPLILAGHGVMQSGAEREMLALAERAQIPIAVTLLGIGGVPASHPLQPRHDGHARRGLGQHGDPGGRPADRARHALRRPRHRQPQDLRAATRRRFTSTSIAPSSTRTSASTSAIAGDLRATLRRVAAASSSAATARRGSRASTSSRATRPSATSRTCPTTATCTRRT